MFKEIKSMFSDSASRRLVSDGARIGLWAMFIMHGEGVINWAKLNAQLMFQNKTLLKFVRGFEKTMTRSVVNLTLGAIVQLASWIMMIWAMRGDETSAVRNVVVGLVIGLVANLWSLMQIIKLHTATEIVIASIGLIGSGINGVLNTLPSFLRFDWGKVSEEKIESMRVYKLLYKTIFWIGMLSIGIAVIVCLNFRVFHGMVLALILFSLALAGLGMTVGYGLPTTTARKWAFGFALTGLVVGFIVVAGGKTFTQLNDKIDQENLTSRCTTQYHKFGPPSDMVFAKQCEMVLGERIVTLFKEFDKLSNKETRTDAEDIRLEALDKAVKAHLKGERAVVNIPKPVVPTCSDGKDNNKNNQIDKDDGSCYGQVETSVCVKRVNNRTEVDVDCKKKVVAGADGKNRVYWFKFNPNLDERDQPKPVIADQGSVAPSAGRVAPRRETPPTVSSNSTPAGRAAITIAKKYGIEY